MKRVRPLEWLLIFVFLNGAFVLLFQISQSYVKDSVVVEPEWMKVAALVMAALSLSALLMPYYLRRFVSAGSVSSQSLFRSPHKSLLVGLAASFAPAIYGFVLLTLGLSLNGFRLFAVTSVLAMIAWVAYWLRHDRFEKPGAQGDS